MAVQLYTNEELPLLIVSRECMGHYPMLVDRLWSHMVGGKGIDVYKQGVTLMYHLKYLLDTKGPSRLLVANKWFVKGMVSLLGNVHMSVQLQDMVQPVESGNLHEKDQNKFMTTYEMEIQLVNLF